MSTTRRLIQVSQLCTLYRAMGASYFDIAVQALKLNNDDVYLNEEYNYYILNN